MGTGCPWAGWHVANRLQRNPTEHASKLTRIGTLRERLSPAQLLFCTPFLVLQVILPVRNPCFLQVLNMLGQEGVLRIVYEFGVAPLKRAPVNQATAIPRIACLASPSICRHGVAFLARLHDGVQA